MILQVDTTDFGKARLVLKEPGRDGKIVRQVEFAAGKKLSQKLLPQIEKLLDAGQATARIAATKQAPQNGAATRLAHLKNLTGIEVNPGPGSFTGLRIGVAVANALGYALNIPVNGRKMVVPRYGGQPNITKV